VTKPIMKVGDTWLMKLRDGGQIVRVRLVSLYETAVEVEERSPLIGWQRPYIVDRSNVVFTERVSP
jgi:hypothetical protein